MMPASVNWPAYAGRWVALVQGGVAGVGLTVEAARAAAQLSRPKEKVQTIFVTEPLPLELPPLMEPIYTALPDRHTVWLVGGAVRDAVLNRPLHDLDFVVAGDACAAARAVAAALGADFYPLDAERDVGRVLTPDFTLDFARLRGATLEEDLRARDFTLNAMALTPDQPQVLLDPLGGLADLRARLIRPCAPTAIADDPLRGMRAIRLAAQLGCRLTPETHPAIRAQADALAQISAERRRDEFLRCLGGPRPAACLRALHRLGLLPHLVPEVLPLVGVTQPPPHTLDAWEHTLSVLDRLSTVLALLGPVHAAEAAADLTLGLVAVKLGRYRHALTEHLNTCPTGDRPRRWLLLLAALLHDIGKPRTRTVEADTGRIRFFNHEQVGAELAARRLTQLCFSNEEIRQVRTIVAHHPRPRQLTRPGALTRRSIYRFWRDTGPAGLEIVLLALADRLAQQNGPPPPQADWALLVETCARLLEAWIEKPREFVDLPALITGHDLLTELGLPPGPPIGAVLEAVREAQAAGEITNRDEALAYARRAAAAPAREEG